MRNFIRDLPHELIEAARIEGASEWQILRHVTIPMVMPVILTAVGLYFFLAPLGLQLVLAAQSAGHLDHEERDEGRRQGKIQPHAEQVQADHQRFMFDALQVQRVIPDQQRGVAAQRQRAEEHGIDPRQGCCGNGKRHHRRCRTN